MDNIAKERFIYIKTLYFNALRCIFDGLFILLEFVDSHTDLKLEDMYKI